jgi:hypothetical protein
MDMIFAYTALYDRYSAAETTLSNDFACSSCNFSNERMVSIFGYPHEVVLDIVDRMPAGLVINHPSHL